MHTEGETPGLTTTPFRTSLAMEGRIFSSKSTPMLVKIRGRDFSSGLKRIRRVISTFCRSEGGRKKENYKSLDYGNTQLTNQIPSLEVTIFVSYLFRGYYFAALRHFITCIGHGNHTFKSRDAVQAEGKRSFWKGSFSRKPRYSVFY